MDRSQERLACPQKKIRRGADKLAPSLGIVKRAARKFNSLLSARVAAGASEHNKFSAEENFRVIILTRLRLRSTSHVQYPQRMRQTRGDIWT